MQIEGVKPDKFPLQTLSGCSYPGVLNQGRWIHAYIDKTGTVIGPILGCAFIDMFAKCGDMEEALKVSKKAERGSWKKPTWLKACRIHKNVKLTGTKSHPQAKQIYRMWGSVAERLEKEGYKPELQNLLLNQDDEAKVAINQHSEKLAVAFQLLRTKPGTTIRTIKNLQTCED
ncbi:hypothetical protein V6N11_041051 [Hibiscus sabdariffa]|uniref:DYW domain-containing protein n=1 Tax=Hibiscus sabdariffa TaxID=183260 RepID=A0ABR2RJN8_9ROSI